MAIRPTHKCFKCKEVFRNEEMVEYSGPRSNTKHWYCKQCHDKQIEKDRFSDTVCRIFGIKLPGAMIWTQRERLINEYGYTDDTIIQCLEYIYNVEKYKKIKPTLGLVTPTNIDKMRQYQRTKKNNSLNLAHAMQTEYKEYIVPVQEFKQKKQELLNPDDWLEMD